MTAIEQIIKDAINGGWRKGHYKMRWGGGRIEQWEYLGNNRSEWTRLMDLSTALLDPTFWEAVGKTRGWNECLGEETESLKQHWLEKISKEKWHRFIDYLQYGVTIEEALIKIE